VNGEFDKDTMNATILANSSGVFSLIPDISVPVSMGESALTASTRSASLTCGVNLDIDVFSMELVKKYFGGILTANFEFEVFERSGDSEILITKKVVQRAYIGVNNIRPIVDMAAMNRVRTGYVNDANAAANTGYEFFVDSNAATLISQSSKAITDDDDLSGYFSIVEDVDNIADTILEFANQKEVYVSIDIDVVDPAFAPATGYPECGGLTSRQIIYLIQRINKIKKLRAIDIVEINSEKDKTGLTTKLGVKILSELL
jgi:hypothetical protein